MKLSYDNERTSVFNVLFIGNLHESKGLFDLLNSISYILKITTNVHFWIAGEWTSQIEEQRANTLLKEHNVEKYVTFVGLIVGDEKRKFFSQGDVLVHPTHYDGQPLVILEAMLTGLPIISTDVGSISETIQHRFNGYVIPKKNPKKIAEAVIELISNKPLKVKMGESSKAIYNKRFNEKIFVNRMKQVFQKVANENR